MLRGLRSVFHACSSEAPREGVQQEVFQTRRKTFNTKAKRLQSKNHSVSKNLVITTVPSNGKATDKDLKKDKVPKWKVESAQLRITLKQTRGMVGAGTEAEAKILKQAKDQLGVTCPNCHRNFNHNAAKRHLPFCVEKAKQRVSGNDSKSRIKSRMNL